LANKREVAVLMFEGFETLDVMGPVELFGMHPDAFHLQFVAENTGNIESAQGQKVVVERKIQLDDNFDIVLVPGGKGTRREIHNKFLLSWITQMATNAELLTSVCSGSALLAGAGVLDGKRATGNKLNFGWIKQQGADVDWVFQARWVEDGKIFTSSGVSAGMDMTLAVISRLLGIKAAEDAADLAEYTWHRDAEFDPFAVERDDDLRYPP